ncbi:hypothetical protein JTE90_017952 [Oedothorax gibbosus]|uniref:SOCS box domain-containing protein n=1 Tax=Oedothorax gibbosus TaxID=931172 RepID=A0AAV6V980_9ARAC|nr:hypothetical protein JTE90_017952 [Oedothorax gibbosus]
MAAKQNEVGFLMRKLYLNAHIDFEAYISPERQMKIHLRQTLKYYEKWRRLVKYRENWWNTQTEKERMDEFERCIVRYLVAVCFWTSYEDSDVVSNLLNTLYDRDEHFEEMFGARPIRLWASKKYGWEDLDTTVRHVLGVTLGKGKKREQQLNYFFMHISKKKLFFLRVGTHWLRHKMETHAQRDNRMCSKSESVFFTDPDILSKFLEYGLFSNANDESVGRLLKGILEIWASGGFLISPDPTEKPYSANIFHKRNAKALEVAAMLLRAVKSVDKSVLFNFVPMQIYVSVPSEKIEILPLLKTRCIGPQKLQHLCRWEIRKQMSDCGQLPDGISFLPIPKFLQQYLGLRRDESDVTFSKGFL